MRTPPSRDICMTVSSANRSVRNGAVAKWHCAVLIGFALWCEPSLSQVSIMPSAPKEQEIVRVQVAAGVIESLSGAYSYDVNATKMSMVANKITVEVKGVARGMNEIGPSYSIDLALGQFPAGDYQVEVKVTSPNGGDISSIGAGSFSVASRAPEAPPRNLTDLWWDPNESGWGINMVQHPSGILFATWFVYGDNGVATWYVIPDARWNAAMQSYSGSMYRTTGPGFCYFSDPICIAPFIPSLVTRSLVGRATITIYPHDHDTAQMFFEIDGKTLLKFVRRQGF